MSAAVITINFVSGAGPAYTVTVNDSTGAQVADHLGDGNGRVYRITGVPDGSTIQVQDDVPPLAPYGVGPTLGKGCWYTPSPTLGLSQMPFDAPGWDNVNDRDKLRLDQEHRQGQTQAPVIDRDLTAPPGSPTVGDRYLVAAGATGAWAGQDDNIAQWNGSSWAFVPAIAGMIVFVNDETIHLTYNGTAWTASLSDAASIRGVNVSLTPPVEGQALIVQGGEYVPANPGSFTEQIVQPARKATAGTINKGQPVAHVSAGASWLNVEVADADDPALTPAIGLAFENITDTATARVLFTGRLQNVDTSMWNVNDPLYLSNTPGVLTNVRPSGANTAVQRIGEVTKKDAVTGEILVIGAGRSNDLPNLQSHYMWIGETGGSPKQMLAIHQHPVEDKDLTVPPGSPSAEDHYIVAVGATGAWAGQDNNIAEWDGAAWQFVVPVEATQVWVKDEQQHYVFNGSAWIQLPGASHVHDATEITSGVLADARVQESNVTQHVAAIDHDLLLNYALAQHRVINDAGPPSTTELYSSSKIEQLVSAAVSNQDFKDSVETVADSAILLTGEQTINGVLTNNSRILVIAQSLPQDNGIYVTSTGGWTRATDADEDSEVTNGMTCWVSNPSSTFYRWQGILISADPIAVDTDPLTFVMVRALDFGTTAGTAAEGNDARIPTQNENDALVGTGTPGAGDPYVNDSDPRMTDSRTPIAHVSTHQPSGSDPIPTAAPTQGIGGANAEGNAETFARSNHDHQLRTTNAGGVDLSIGDIPDGQLFQRSGTSIIGASAAAGGWPYTNIITVDQTDPEADFSTIVAAMAAASAGDTIAVGPATYAETFTQKNGVTLLGIGGEEGSVKIEVVTDGSTAPDIITFNSAGGDAVIAGVVIKLEKTGVTAPNTGDAAAIRLLAGTLHLYRCEVEIESSAGGADSGMALHGVRADAAAVLTLESHLCEIKSERAGGTTTPMNGVTITNGGAGGTMFLQSTFLMEGPWGSAKDANYTGLNISGLTSAVLVNGAYDHVNTAGPPTSPLTVLHAAIGVAEGFGTDWTVSADVKIGLKNLASDPNANIGDIWMNETDENIYARMKIGGVDVTRGIVNPFGNVFKVSKGGNADFTTIQAAIDNLSPNPGIVLIGPGTYNENVVVHDGVQLVGLAGPDETIIKFEAPGGTSSVLHMNTAGGIARIRGISVIHDHSLSTGAFRSAVYVQKGLLIAEDCIISVEDNNEVGAHTKVEVLYVDTESTCRFVGRNTTIASNAGANPTYNITHAALHNIRTDGNENLFINCTEAILGASPGTMVGIEFNDVNCRTVIEGGSYNDLDVTGLGIEPLILKGHVEITNINTDGTTPIEVPSVIRSQLRGLTSATEPPVIADGQLWHRTDVDGGDILARVGGITKSITNPLENVLNVSPTAEKADYQTVQAAITAASAGDVIVIAPGTYNETVVGKDSVTIIGVGGRERTILQSTHDGLTADKITFDFNTASGLCVIMGLTVRMTKTGAGGFESISVNAELGTIRAYDCLFLNDDSGSVVGGSAGGLVATSAEIAGPAAAAIEAYRCLFHANKSGTSSGWAHDLFYGSGTLDHLFVDCVFDHIGFKEGGESFGFEPDGTATYTIDGGHVDELDLSIGSASTTVVLRGAPAIDAVTEGSVLLVTGQDALKGLHGFTSDPPVAGLKDGDIWHNDTSDEIKARLGGATVVLGAVTPASTWPFSNTLTVDPSSPNADFSTVQAAVTAASSGDTVIVGPGIYAETVALKTGVTIEGIGDPDNTLITAAPAASTGVLNFNSAGTTTRIENLEVWVDHSLTGNSNARALNAAAGEVIAHNCIFDVRDANEVGVHGNVQVVHVGTNATAKVVMHNCRVVSNAGANPTYDITHIDLDNAPAAGDDTELVNCKQQIEGASPGTMRGVYATNAGARLIIDGGLINEVDLTNMTTGQFIERGMPDIESITTTTSSTVVTPYAERLKLRGYTAANLPPALADGQIWHQTDDNTLKARLGGSTVTFAPPASFPFDNTIKVDPTNPGADFTTIGGAMATASAGDIIVVGPATYTEEVDCKDGVTVVGLGGRERTLVQSSRGGTVGDDATTRGVFKLDTINAECTLIGITAEMTIDGDTAPRTDYAALFRAQGRFICRDSDFLLKTTPPISSSAGSASEGSGSNDKGIEAHNCRFITTKDATDSGTFYCVDLDNASQRSDFHNCEMFNDGSGTITKALEITSGGVLINGGRYESIRNATSAASFMYGEPLLDEGYVQQLGAASEGSMTRSSDFEQFRTISTLGPKDAASGRSWGIPDFEGVQEFHDLDDANIETLIMEKGDYGQVTLGSFNNRMCFVYPGRIGRDVNTANFTDILDGSVAPREAVVTIDTTSDTRVIEFHNICFAVRKLNDISGTNDVVALHIVQGKVRLVNCLIRVDVPGASKAIGVRIEGNGSLEAYNCMFERSSVSATADRIGIECANGAEGRSRLVNCFFKNTSSVDFDYDIVEVPGSTGQMLINGGEARNVDWRQGGDLDLIGGVDFVSANKNPGLWQVESPNLRVAAHHKIRLDLIPSSSATAENLDEGDIFYAHTPESTRDAKLYAVLGDLVGGQVVQDLLHPPFDNFHTVGNVAASDSDHDINTAGGETIWIGPGTYNADVFDNSDGVAWVGMDRDKCIIDLGSIGASNRSMWDFNFGTSTYKSTIKNLTMIMDIGAGSAAFEVIHMRGTGTLVVENCRIVMKTPVGKISGDSNILLLEGTGSVHFINCEFETDRQGSAPLNVFDVQPSGAQTSPVRFVNCWLTVTNTVPSGRLDTANADVEIVGGNFTDLNIVNTAGGSLHIAGLPGANRNDLTSVTQATFAPNMGLNLGQHLTTQLVTLADGDIIHRTASAANGPGNLEMGVTHNSVLRQVPVLGEAGIYGNGSDGSVTISTTVTLTRDMFYRTLDLNSGGVLQPDGYRIHVQFTCTFAAGSITANGVAGQDGAAGGAGGAGGGNSNVLGEGGSGGAGGTNSDGTTGVSTTGSIALGDGGTGGDAGARNGGAGGSSTGFSNGASPEASLSGGAGYVITAPNTVEVLSGGGGGGGGAGSGAGNTGGGGGGGGGAVILIARRIRANGGTVTIQARGGDGGDGGVTGDTGGGGGGAGGSVLLITDHNPHGTNISVSGGAGGVGNGAGLSGSGGNSGNFFTLYPS
jgi:pectin methylesterase-like acyl-CoA thioesterase